jgi:hypothetical protein
MKKGGTIMSEEVICPWCQTEIHWDPEIGPERECPYCSNELSGYRTLKIGLDHEQEDEEQHSSEPEVENLWGDEDEDDLTSFVVPSGGSLAAQAVVEQLLDNQFESPECANCREYLLEVGHETIGSEQFKPVHSKLLTEPLLAGPFQLIRYVCPSCFHTETKLSRADQDRFVRVLADAAEHM